MKGCVIIQKSKDIDSKNLRYENMKYFNNEILREFTLALLALQAKPLKERIWTTSLTNVDILYKQGN